MWTVYATPPTGNMRHVWDFKDGYFPRTVYGKDYANKIAKEAKSKGGTDVRVEKAKRGAK